MLFHYINRPVNVFLDESPFPFDGHILKGGMLRIGARRFKALLEEHPTPGLSLDLLPGGDLPEDMAWARGSPMLAGAWGRFTAAVERAGETALPAEVRAHLNERLAEWNGEDPGLGTSWIEDSLAGLHDQMRPAGRLALLAAIASYRVDASVIEDFRDGRPDHDVVAAVSWAALAAARRIGSRLLVPA
jgi:hypothetical protein